MVGLYGYINYKYKGKSVTSFFHPDDISKIETIRSPSRSKDEKELTEEDLINCSHIVETEYSTKHITNSSLGVNDIVKYVDGEFYVGKIRWIDFCNSKMEIPMFKSDYKMDNNLDTLITSITSEKINGVYKDWKKLIDKYFDDINDIQILLTISKYIRVISNEIKMNKISRDGRGTDYKVDYKDVFVFRFLCFCCSILPGVISISKKTLDIVFKITNYYFWNKVRNYIFSKTINTSMKKWKYTWLDTRKLLEHQKYSVEHAMSRIKENKRGNILWMPVGSGKTFIVINILNLLNKMKLLPKYVVYTLPTAAYTSVSLEFKKAGIPYNLLDTTNKGKTNKMNILKEYHINIINHDHIREQEMYTQLLNKAPEIFLILDEFHYMMNTGTLRTSIALELSKSVYNFIAMTGTLIKNKDSESLINWISQVVEFELTPSNYLVGISALISRKVDYGIEERRKFIEVPMNNKEYYKIVDKKFGGTAQETNFSQAVKICYKITQEEIYKTTIDVLKEEQNVFVIALNKEMQDWLDNKFTELGYKTFCVSTGNSISYTPGKHMDIQIVITTPTHSAGYNLTAIKTMITGIYFSNQATRTQLVGRIVRMGQKSKYVNIITIHTGILSYTLLHYEQTRSLEKAISALAKTF